MSFSPVAPIDVIFLYRWKIVAGCPGAVRRSDGMSELPGEHGTRVVIDRGRQDQERRLLLRWRFGLLFGVGEQIGRDRRAVELDVALLVAERVDVFPELDGVEYDSSA